ncbi:MAG: tRNA (adenosine(37)-N6)-threonylcarbamoyltransferase complex dimerization subunit type 1 TsaB [Clostridia bacterium]|nr:tRNA (adenosine(37)-N6)-threonylcarbamoyltransferase complex dimerization subunit type 1 TsaB [Clostridia bacterium]
MNILGFETTDAIASVALYLDGAVVQKTLSGEKRHAESVLPAAEELLRENGLSTRDMDAFVADVGPGSFTGVRIGVCMANALGLAHNKPVIAVNSLEALAHRAGGFAPGTTVCALIDARNGNGYGAVYHGGECVAAPCACEIEPFTAALPNGCKTVGTAFGGELPAAADVVALAAGRDGQAQVSPLYLKPSQAERMKQL